MQALAPQVADPVPHPPIFGAIACRKVLDAEGSGLDRHADGGVPA